MMLRMNRLRTNVRLLLLEYGWTQQDLAEALGVDKGNLSRTLSGRNSPRLAYVYRIADALEVDVSRLFDPKTERITSGKNHQK